MGSGSSRLGSTTSSPPRTTKVNRTKQRLASLICGASSSTSQREDCFVESVVNSTGDHHVAHNSTCPSYEYTTTSNRTARFNSSSSPRSEPGTSSKSSITSDDQASSEHDPHIDSSSKRKCLSESEEVHPPRRSDAESKSYQQRLGDTLGTHLTGEAPPVSVNRGRFTVSTDIDSLVSNPHGDVTPQTRSEVVSSSSVHHGGRERWTSFFEESNEVTGNHNSNVDAVPAVADPGIASQSRRDEAVQEVIPSGLGLLLSDRVQARPEGNVLHVDVVSLSSSTLPNINNEISARETRRNSRRMFWDAFSSRSSRRQADFPAILLTTDDTDPIGSRRRWLLDIGDDFFDDGVGGDSWHFGRRNRFTNERRRNSRSEFWDRLRGAASENRSRTSCPLDLHPDGSCSCELDEEASALSSISRIVLLAEALFEVLDEIHRQPESFSLSLLSVPAPESVVDALPVKTYEKPSTADHVDDVDQCHICLVEYEEGEKIRVLPCHHEYHSSCVDKWLKEVHGVCPLCRGDVRGEGFREGATTSADVDLT